MSADPTRRAVLLQLTGGLALLPAAAAALSELSPALAAAPDEEHYWELARQQFDALYETHGIAGSPSGGPRLCPHLHNTRAHVQRAIDGVAALKSLIA